MGRRTNLLARLFGAALAFGGMDAASAQPARDSVEAAFQAYTAARTRGDIPGAEAAAARALQVSEARDGDGGSTAVLALNLAMARLDAGRPADAVAPAQRALDLVHKGAKGVEELQARLVLGEAQLTANPDADERPVVAALKAAENRPDLDETAYSAALALTKAALRVKKAENLVAAWHSVAVHAAGSGDRTGLVRGRALTEEAVALISLRRFREASAPINEAGRLLVGLAPEQADPDKVTTGEYYFAEASAVASALRAVREDDVLNKPDREFWNKLDRPELATLPPRCKGTFNYSARLHYPDRPLRMGEVGAVAVRFRMDETGKELGMKTISTVVAEDFRRAVEDPRIRWTFEIDRKKSVPGCRLQTNDWLTSVVFAFAG